MAKSLVFRKWLVLVLLLVPTLMSAQDVVDSVEVDPYEGMIIETYETEDGGTASDTIYLDNQDEDSLRITQYDLKEFDWVDICYNPKYAFFTSSTLSVPPVYLSSLRRFSVFLMNLSFFSANVS